MGESKASTTKITEGTKEVQKPVRIQRRRVKGWRMPANTLCVTRPGVFGNPFGGDRNEAVRAYRAWLKGEPTGHLYAALDKGHRDEVLRRLPELRGKNLACFCDFSGPCHADVLLEVANADDSQ